MVAKKVYNVVIGWLVGNGYILFCCCLYHLNAQIKLANVFFLYEAHVCM